MRHALILALALCVTTPGFSKYFAVPLEYQEDEWQNEFDVERNAQFFALLRTSKAYKDNKTDYYINDDGSVTLLLPYEQTSNVRLGNLCKEYLGKDATFLASEDNELTDKTLLDCSLSPSIKFVSRRYKSIKTNIGRFLIISPYFRWHGELHKFYGDDSQKVCRLFGFTNVVGIGTQYSNTPLKTARLSTSSLFKKEEYHNRYLFRITCSNTPVVSVNQLDASEDDVLLEGEGL
jgi:hypothetical protein